MTSNFDQLLQFSYSPSDAEFLINVLNIPGLGRKTAFDILLYVKKLKVSMPEFLANIPAILNKKCINKKIVEKVNTTFIEQKNKSIIKRLKSENIRVVSFWEKDYPSVLLETDDFPLQLYTQGNIRLLQEKSIAVVGTRKVTSYGVSVTKKIISELVSYDYTIISGCMYGVDAVAHQETINSGGKTIAVLGYGFNQVVSSHLRELQKDILMHNGCLITEYPPGTSANKGTFPERNRIVAGMSQGVLVVEAALRSGTHITARCAIDAGREVFAVPGSIFNPYTQGTKFLIDQGAKLVTSGADIVAEFKKVFTIPNSGQADTVVDMHLLVESLGLDTHSQKIVRELLFMPRSTDDLAKATQLTIKELLTVLGMLELKNIIENEAGVWHCML